MSAAHDADHLDTHDAAPSSDRTHALEEIAGFINGNQSVSLIGPAGSGKTTLLLHLMRPCAWAALGLDAHTLFAYMDGARLAGAGPPDIFRHLGAALTGALAANAQPAEPLLAAIDGNPSRLAFEAALRRLNKRGSRVVVVLDAFERLGANSRLDLPFFNALRSATARYQLVFLTASARPLIELTYAGRTEEVLSSPFFNIFALVRLGPPAGIKLSR